MAAQPLSSLAQGLGTVSQRPSTQWESPGLDGPPSQSSAAKGPRDRGLGEGGWAGFRGTPKVGAHFHKVSKNSRSKSFLHEKQTKKTPRLTGPEPSRMAGLGQAPPPTNSHWARQTLHRPTHQRTRGFFGGLRGPEGRW